MKEEEKQQMNKKVDAYQGNTSFPSALTIQSHAAMVKALEPITTTMQSYHNLIQKNSGVVSAVTAMGNRTESVMPKNPIGTMTSTLDVVNNAMKPYKDVSLLHSRVLEIIEASTKTPEILALQSQLYDCIPTVTPAVTAVTEYVNNLSSQWNKALATTNPSKRSMPAQNLAVVRILPGYSKLNLPNGSKRVLKSLPKVTAQKLTKTEEILFDPKEKHFYHKDSPEQKLTADQVTVVESSQDLFADITLDELLSFESQLYEDLTFAMYHPIGRKIFDIIMGWNRFITFDADIYYHARKIEEGQAPFLDQEMMKAPTNVSSHGRYNAIGKSCYYIAETKEGVINEIRKHSGGRKVDIQVVGLKPIKDAKIIDLSGEIKGVNRFIEHLRFAVDNEEGRIIKNYLLPNFVASCCKKIGIEGIKYRSTGYNCCVLWKDDYFEFVEGSREIF